MTALPKNPVELLTAYDAAADNIERRAVVLGLALLVAGAKARAAKLEAFLFASVIFNAGAVALIALVILFH